MALSATSVSASRGVSFDMGSSLSSLFNLLDRMYILEPLNAKPIASLCESDDQQQPASSQASVAKIPVGNIRPSLEMSGINIIGGQLKHQLGKPRKILLPAA